MILQANATTIPLADESVDLICTSPPYFALRSYRDGDEHYAGQIGSEATPQDFLEALWAVTAEMKRVLKPTGSIFVNLGDKYQEKSLMGLPWRYAIGCIDHLGLILRAEIIWAKPNSLPESVVDRVRRSHEQWFHFTKQGRYFAAVDEVREPHVYPDDNRHERGPRIRYDGVVASGNTTGCNPLGKLPGSVWTIPSEPLIIPAAVQEHYDLPDHFAAFPQELPRRIILGWSPSGICVECGEGRWPVVLRQFTGEYNSSEGASQRLRSALTGGTDKVTLGRTDDIDRRITGYACLCPANMPGNMPPTRRAVILDPFSGTGTVVGVARALGRYGVGLDLSMDYCRLGRWRDERSGHFAKTSQRTHRENQADLFA